MSNSIIQIPQPVNEPVRNYAPGSPERASLHATLQKMRGEQVDIPAIIGGKEVFTGDTETIHPPHDHQHVLGQFHQCGTKEVNAAIAASQKARNDWNNMHWADRCGVFLKAADLLAGPWRDTINAATMLGQSKNPYQAEIDATCELIDFFRFNAWYVKQIYSDQPMYSPAGTWNQLEYRGLEGFIFAVTPFNFTSIAANLPTAPAMMGTVSVWKPASTAVYSGYYLMKLFEAAGLPAGVINFVPGRGAAVGDPIFASPDFAGIHFTGSTSTFNNMWQTIAGNINNYKTYPRIVGETGGKDFILAHASTNPEVLATAIVRGSFEYQGQKCSASSRIYVPNNIWSEVQDSMQAQLAQMKMGPVEDFTNFINAVIDRKAYNSITGYIDHAKAANDAKVIAGGNYSDEKGYFIEPTVVLAENPKYKTMCEEIFGPVTSVHVYEADKWNETIELVNSTSPYALTGAIFAQERGVIAAARAGLADAAGNFYINDKPTGAVVGQQPFGGARASGTNDKAGSYLNMTRWTSARSIKENFNPPSHFAYQFHQADPNDPKY